MGDYVILRSNCYQNRNVNTGENDVDDFDLATNISKYRVSTSGEKEIKNSPIEGAIKGMLYVQKNALEITQELATNEGQRFIRFFNGTSWSEWKLVGGKDIDTSIFYTKEEVDEIVGNVSGGSSDSVFDNEYRLLLNNTIQIMKQRGIK